MWDDPRALNMLSVTLSLCALCALLSAGLLWSGRQPTFAIHKVVFRGEMKQVNPAHLEAVVHESLRGTFFSLRLDAAKAAFGQVPWVRGVSVRRRWPDEIEITLSEHLPLARWNVAMGEPMLVNTFGELFQADYAGDLPSFEGPEGSSSEITQRYSEFSRQLARIGRSVASIRLSSRYSWELDLDNSLVVELGRDSVDTRLERFVAYYPTALSNIAAPIQAVDMRYRNGVAVRVAEVKERPTMRHRG